MSSMMDDLRAKHKALTESKEIDLQLPGYGPTLVARYRVLDVKTEISAIGKRNAQATDDTIEQALLGSMDAMAKACVELFTTKDEKLVPLREDPMFNDDGIPVRYDGRLAKFMGWGEEVTSARDVIMMLFDGVDTMILDHGQTLSRWMTNITRKAGDNFLGGM